MNTVRLFVSSAAKGERGTPGALTVARVELTLEVVLCYRGAFELLGIGFIPTHLGFAGARASFRANPTIPTCSAGPSGSPLTLWRMVVAGLTL
jgi:hypothetical protein